MKTERYNYTARQAIDPYNASDADYILAHSNAFDTATLAIALQTEARTNLEEWAE